MSNFGDAGVVKFGRSIRGKKELDNWGPSTHWLSAGEKEIMNKHVKKQKRTFDPKHRCDPLI